MNQIEKLIEELCPNGVEYKPLGEVGTFSRGGGVQKKDFTESGVGCIHYGQIYTHYGIWATETKSFVSSLTFSKAKKAQPGDIIIADTSENDEDLCKAVAWLGEDSVAVSNHTLIFTTELNPKFVSYFLRSLPFQKQKRKFVFGTKVRSISGTNMGRILLPCPPLEIQQEIVRILDTFQALEAELETELKAELEARKKQYEFYRHSFFSNENFSRFEPLGNLSDIGTGARNSNEAQESGKYCFYTRGKTIKYLDKYDFDEIAIITAGDGVGVGKVIHFMDGKYALHQRAYRIHPTSEAIIPKFIYHFMHAQFLEYMERKSVHASVTSVRMKMLVEFPIPIPPLEEQQRIVNILDKFDAHVNDLTSGLPAEIEARRKQYEYYRDQLLTFKELAA